MNTISKKQFRNYIQNFDFTNLFNQLGWNFVDEHFPVKLKDETYHFRAVAEKGGFRIIVSQPTKTTDLPDYNTRLQLDRKIARLYREHLLIFTDSKQTTQIWQLFVKQLGKPSRLSETRWHKGQEPELLYQKTSHLFFTLDEEENITIADVVERVNDNFSKNVEQVTKKFYESFRKEHQKFIAFIEGISIVTDREWYASLMLNRLMFCYFIQKKGFLDNNPNYLKEKLLACQQRKGKDQFYVSFYKNFLMALFHQGLGSPIHDSEFKKELGRIPYLNGGLFDVHDLEKNYNIDIGDDAFIKVFEFFDQYNWHLDTRVNASGKDINPDVIGYIFEKYINDRAQMGAYYTKEDITDYISKNCIIPYLFDETARNYPKAFKPGAEMWQMLRESGDEYIYPAVKHGILLPSPVGEGPGVRPLPEEIAIGLDTKQPNLLERRTAWNKPAPAEFALPTEIWREVVDRRNRYAEVKTKIENGEISQINDFITYNLNIRQFGQDVVENTTDPEFLRHFYKSLNSVTILDPTCGSGAFLFAAMNILEPLYEACITRMRGFTEDEDEENKHEKSNFSNKYKFFRDKLAEIQNENHPNQAYFIFKSIILNNLYGVDIMKEAVEIAKLRLFLKLVATVEADYSKSNLGLEPLPDVDFNIRAGNTLVGFATEKELQHGLTYTLDGVRAKPAIEEKCELVAMAFTRYKQIQLTQEIDYKDFKQAKENLNNKLTVLNQHLNKLLHQQSHSIPYEKWLHTHQPFHWFAEFYEIVQARGGFDVIIGNPPYVAINKINYKLKSDVFKCSDLFGYVISRNFQIIKKDSRFGFIVMHNLAFSRNFSSVRKVIKANANKGYFSFFARIPAGLFSGDVRVRNCIFILENNQKQESKLFYTTRIHRWFSEARDFLIQKISYSKFSFNEEIPMFYDKILADYYQSSKGKPLSYYEIQNSKFKLYFKQSAYNWISVSDIPAPCFDNNGMEISQSQVSDFSLKSDSIMKLSILLINGKLFFSNWLTYGDEFHVTRDDIFSIKTPFEFLSESDLKELHTLAEEFIVNLPKSIQYKLNAGKNVGTFSTSKLWHITDKSDRIFLKYLCDNPEEVFESIENHISQTVLTTTENNDEIE